MNDEKKETEILHVKRKPGDLEKIEAMKKAVEGLPAPIPRKPVMTVASCIAWCMEKLKVIDFQILPEEFESFCYAVEPILSEELNAYETP